ncbi:hypothetical protein TVAG_465130 [Trichomonas vaginalis G3]|uniref:Uncharacterized protein n=1 Tax=Trichomonas vaginalis (strain ATCC PRA-98 / G3) TaxID=412133 RepID=A2DTX8_TRIV3|nr:hypothetical protein TVAGG3_0719090 [Trichomonas vaginalis G3]EAY16125.1 hypothetical protein TVAG_465130 [Trichomonas vaginalis G3]KAI5510458.1 hypothetical protein TVAGG3_0719090 [Trichomonas vaginalis G3]|eukprot:XP_001328348.1 hypothetical protein [Trichomonas vaginalis G3]
MTPVSTKGFFKCSCEPEGDHFTVEPSSFTYGTKIMPTVDGGLYTCWILNGKEYIIRSGFTETFQFDIILDASRNKEGCLEFCCDSKCKQYTFLYDIEPIDCEDCILSNNRMKPTEIIRNDAEESIGNISITMIIDIFNQTKNISIPPPEYPRYSYYIPGIEIKTPNNQQFLKNDDKKLIIEGSAVDGDPDDEIRVCFSIDGILQYCFYVPNATYFSESVDFNKCYLCSLEEGPNHNISIFAKDFVGQKSNEVVLNFSYMFNPPQLTISKFPLTNYKRNIDKSIHVEGNVIDRDGLGKVNVTISIDDIMIDFREINIENISEHLFQFDVKFTSNMTESYHNLLISAVDERGKQSNQFKRIFYYEFNRPYLDIYTSDKQKIIGIRKFAVSGSVSDDDGQGSLVIIYSLDNNDQTELISVQLVNNSPFIFDESINLTESIQAGIHSLELFVVDDNNKESTHRFLSFTYLLHSKPRHKKLIRSAAYLSSALRYISK